MKIYHSKAMNVHPCRRYTVKMIEAQVLDKISLLRLAFTGLTENELQEMAAMSQLCAYPPEHTLCHEGAYEGNLLYYW